MENHKKHSLGHRAFLVFFTRRLKVPIILFVLSAGIWYAKRWVPAEYAPWGDFVSNVAFLTSTAYLLVIFLFTYLEYRLYTYVFTEEAFVMTSGLAMRNEVAALYHQIQNVNINHSPLSRMIGVSELVIVMNGMGHDPQHSKLILPAVGKMKAKLVQKELLVRARKSAA